MKKKGARRVCEDTRVSTTQSHKSSSFPIPYLFKLSQSLIRVSYAWQGSRASISQESPGTALWIESWVLKYQLTLAISNWTVSTGLWHLIVWVAVVLTVGGYKWL